MLKVEFLIVELDSLLLFVQVSMNDVQQRVLNQHAKPFGDEGEYLAAWRTVADLQSGPLR